MRGSTASRYLTPLSPPSNTPSPCKKISEWLVPRCDLEENLVLDSLILQCGVIYCNGARLDAEGVGLCAVIQVGQPEVRQAWCSSVPYIIQAPCIHRRHSRHRFGKAILALSVLLPQITPLPTALHDNTLYQNLLTKPRCSIKYYTSVAFLLHYAKL
jgi:hypothetical protein